MKLRQVKFKKMAAVLCVLAATVPAVYAQSVKVAHAWVRPTAPGQTSASAYVELTSDTQAALVAAGSPLAARAELHSMSMEGGIMRMRALARVELPAGQTVKLAPGSTHLMLVDLKRPLKVGDKVPLVLTVQSSGTSVTTVRVEAEVKAAPGEPHKHWRYYGKLYRAFALGQPVDEDGAAAKYTDGILELTLPKKAAAQAKRIAIQWWRKRALSAAVFVNVKR